MIWSKTAFNIYMGDAMAQEPVASRDAWAILQADILFADASTDRDVVLTNTTGDRALADALASEQPIVARRSGSLVARGARDARG